MCVVCVNYLICILGERKNKYENTDSLYRWIDFKFWGHIGFVLEALLESFPQSILQMVAMAYFQQMSLFTIYMRFFFLFVFLLLCILSFFLIFPKQIANLRNLNKKNKKMKKKTNVETLYL